MAGINISFVSDVRQFLTGTKDVERAMDRVGDSLDDIAREGRRSGDKVGDALQDASRDGEKASDKLEKSFRRDFEKVADHAKDAGRDIGRHVEDGTEKAARGMDDLKQEASSSAREAAASFSGSADDIGDFIQEVSANAFAGFGPAGAAAGLAAAAGLGVMFNRVDEGAAAAEQRIQDMYDDMIESGLDYLSDEAVIDRINDIVKGAEGAVISMADAQTYADTLGIKVEDVVAAFAGSPRAANDLAAAIAASRDRAQELANTVGSTVDETDDNVLAATQLYDAVGDVESAFAGVTGELDKTREKLDVGRGAAEAWTETGRRSAEQREREKAAMDGVYQRYEDLDAKTFAPKSIVLKPDTHELDAELAKPRVVRVGVAARPGTTVVI